MSHPEHQRAGAAITARLAVLTLSDTRTRQTDASGQRIQELAAVGGIAGPKVVFALPGSTKAVELAMSKLILPELGHLLAGLRK